MPLQSTENTVLHEGRRRRRASKGQQTTGPRQGSSTVRWEGRERLHHPRPAPGRVLRGVSRVRPAAGRPGGPRWRPPRRAPPLRTSSTARSPSVDPRPAVELVEQARASVPVPTTMTFSPRFGPLSARPREHGRRDGPGRRVLDGVPNSLPDGVLDHVVVDLVDLPRRQPPAPRQARIVEQGGPDLAASARPRRLAHAAAPRAWSRRRGQGVSSSARRGSHCTPAAGRADRHSAAAGRQPRPWRRPAGQHTRAAGFNIKRSMMPSV